jgi:hypothetical protein
MSESPCCEDRVDECSMKYSVGAHGKEIELYFGLYGEVSLLCDL